MHHRRCLAPALMTQRQAPSEARYAALQSKISRLSTGTAPIPERRTSTVECATASTTSDRTTHAVPVTTSCNRVEVRVGLGISKPMLNQRMKDPDHDDRNGQTAMIHVVTASSFTYACTRSMLDPAPAMHLLLSAMANTPRKKMLNSSMPMLCTIRSRHGRMTACRITLCT